jgi:hypothetical protein
MPAPPRRLLALAILMLVITTGAACGRGTPNSASTPPAPGQEGFGSGPPPTATTRPPTTTKPPSYPTTARKYAEAVLAAWVQHRTERLANLTTAEVQEQVMEIPGPPDPNWTFVKCDGAAGSSYCRYHNKDGDAVTLRITNSLLGKAHAAVAVTFDATTFPDNGLDYVEAFIEAWRLANIPRMNALAKPEVVTYVRVGPAPESPVYAEIGGGGGLLQIAVTNTDGFHLQLDIGTTLLGMPDAIVGYAP